MATIKGVECMEKYGGSFVKALASAWYQADLINKKKLESTFEYFKEYDEKAKGLERF